jgi:ATP synthase subunit H
LPVALAQEANGRWAITYLAQLHPLIEPRASKLRPDIVHGETF